MILKLTRGVWTRMVLLGVLMMCPVLCAAQSPETEAVKIPIENYFKAQATGDAEYIRKAFHPEARLFFVREGKFSQLTLAEFADRFTGKAAPDEAQRKRRIDSIDITGNAAVVKVVLEYPTVTFTDYMSMLKIEGEWKIVNKTFYAQPKK